MPLSTSQRGGLIPQRTQKLANRMVAALTGIVPTMGFLSRGERDPRFAVASADLTGVHVLRGAPAPKSGFYHLGGSGICGEEPIIRTLGEALERYSQFVCEVSGQVRSDLLSYADLRATGKRVLDADRLSFFTAEQFDTPDFLYDRFTEDAPLGWVSLPSLTHREPLWVPAQLVFAGYAVKRQAKEPWLLSAVTTGTAAHTDPLRAMRGALLEIIQVDAAMGHWFTRARGREIQLDERTRPVQGIIAEYFQDSGIEPTFYSISSVDLPGFHVACALRDPSGCKPTLCFGLGSDLGLNEAMYKALIEGVAVLQLAKATMALERAPATEQSFADLEANVAYYAAGNDAELLQHKFAGGTVAASDLPADQLSTTEAEVALLLQAFATTGKELLFSDLTTDDIRELGFVALRVWCPDTISLCLPGFPPAAHPRFTTYGGFSNPRPHPYP